MTARPIVDLLFLFSRGIHLIIQCKSETESKIQLLLEALPILRCGALARRGQSSKLLDGTTTTTKSIKEQSSRCIARYADRQDFAPQAESFTTFHHISPLRFDSSVILQFGRFLSSGRVPSDLGSTGATFCRWNFDSAFDRPKDRSSAVFDPKRKLRLRPCHTRGSGRNSKLGYLG